MAQLKHNQVSASALIEVVIAMVIILIVFTLATSIFSGILRATPNLRQPYIYSIADSIITSTDEKMEQEDLIIGDSLTFVKEITPLEGYNDLYKIVVRVKDHGKESGVFSRIVKLKDNDN
jgi:hypothetical protein